MNQKYNQWVLKNFPTAESALNKCHKACIEMKKEFPELILTNGEVQVGIEKDMRTHWWLKTVNDEIIDPTAHQYQLFNLKSKLKSGILRLITQTFKL